jgi:hypothetical protein
MHRHRDAFKNWRYLHEQNYAAPICGVLAAAFFIWL